MRDLHRQNLVLLMNFVHKLHQGVVLAPSVGKQRTRHTSSLPVFSLSWVGRLLGIFSDVAGARQTSRNFLPSTGLFLVTNVELPGCCSRRCVGPYGLRVTNLPLKLKSPSTPLILISKCSSLYRCGQISQNRKTRKGCCRSQAALRRSTPLWLQDV